MPTSTGGTTKRRRACDGTLHTQAAFQGLVAGLTVQAFEWVRALVIGLFAMFLSATSVHVPRFPTRFDDVEVEGRRFQAPAGLILADHAARDLLPRRQVLQLRRPPRLPVAAFKGVYYAMGLLRRLQRPVSV